MKDTYYLYVDFYGLGDYVDLSAYFMEFTSDTGSDDPSAFVAAPGRCKIVLNNEDRRFSPLNSTGPYYGYLRPGLAITFLVDVGGVAYVLFKGFVESWEPDSGSAGTRLCHLCAVDWLGWLEKTRLAMPLLENVSTSALVQHVYNIAQRAAVAYLDVEARGVPAAGNTITLNGTTYVWVVALATTPVVPGEVLLATKVEDCIDNLLAAINGAEGDGVKYAVGTVRPSMLTASPHVSSYRQLQSYNPVRLYRMGDVSGAVTCVGTNGAVGNGTSSGSPVYGVPGMGAISRAAYFDGVNDFVALPTMVMKNKSFSFELWIKPDSGPAVDQSMISLHTDYVAGKLLTFRLHNTGGLSVAYALDDIYTPDGVVAFGGSSFYHVVYTYDYTTDLSKIYVNGVERGSGNAGPFIGDTPIIQIAAWNTSEFYKGAMDEVAIYWSALSPAQVAAHYSAWVSGFHAYQLVVQADSPVRYYQFSELSGTIAFDDGSTGTNGTYTGGVTLGVAGVGAGGVYLERLGDPDTAMRFDGATNYVDLPLLSIDNKSFSVSAWIRPATGSLPSVQSYFTVSASPTDFSFRLFDTGVLRFNIVPVVDTPAGTIKFGVWNHVVFCFDVVAQMAYWYVNGVLVASGAHAGATSPATSMAIASNVDSATSFKGDVDEFAILFRVLTLAEIQALHVQRTQSAGLDVVAALPGSVGNTYTVSATGTALVPGGSVLAHGVDSPVGEEAIIDAGMQTATLAGDLWAYGTSWLPDLLEQITRSEFGWCYVSRDNRLTWKNTAYTFKRVAATPALTLSDGADQVSFTSVERVANRITVSIEPVVIDIAISTVGKNTGAIRIPALSGTSRWNPFMGWGGGDLVLLLPASTDPTVIVLPFIDQVSGLPISAKDLVLPLLAGTDWVANTRSDGLGEDYTYYSIFPYTLGVLAFSVASTGRAAEISVTNYATGDLYLTLLQVRGYAIKRLNPVTFVQADSASMSTYGVRDMTFALPLPVSEFFAQSLSSYLLSRYKDAAFCVSKIHVHDELIGGTSVWSLTYGDLIAITETQTGVVSQRCMIAGLHYKVSRLTGEVKVTFDVRRLDDLTYGIYDDVVYGKLDTTMRFCV